MTGESPGHGPRLRLEFCGEWIDLPTDRAFAIGRDADFDVDENPYLHRRFIEFARRDHLWWIANVGGQLAATVCDADTRVQAWLAPGAHLPVVFPATLVRFAAGPTTYEVALHLDAAPFASAPVARPVDGRTTLGRLTLTEEQRLLIVVLAEPALRQPGTGTTQLPSSAVAAERLGWPITKFNRKLDNVCQKLKKAGVRGLHGEAERLASGRRARLVEYALSARLVTAEDLQDLDRAVADRGP